MKTRTPWLLLALAVVVATVSWWSVKQTPRREPPEDKPPVRPAVPTASAGAPAVAGGAAAPSAARVPEATTSAHAVADDSAAPADGRAPEAPAAPPYRTTPMPGQALREVRALVDQQKIGAARALAEHYLDEIPEGPEAAQIKSLTGVHPHPYAPPR